MTRFLKLGADDSETAATEYAIMITMVAAALLLACDAAGLGVPSRQIAALSPVHALISVALLLAVGLICHAHYRQHRAKHAIDELHCGLDVVSEPAHNPNYHKRQEIQRMLLRHFDAAVNNR